MSESGGTTLTRYSRRIERAWSARLERPTVLSQRDFDAIESWFARRIPLAVVMEAIEDAFSRRSGAARRGLGRTIGPAVEDAYSVLAETRAFSSEAPEPPAAPPAAEADAALRERIAREVERELEPYRERLDPDQLERTRHAAIEERLRRSRDC